MERVARLQALWGRAMSFQSAIYEGQVRHRRFAPVEHEFANRLFLMYLDLDEIEEVFRRKWFFSTRPALAWFRRADHLGDPGQPLAESVRDLVAAQAGWRPDGPIRLLTHLRYFGYCFNPLSVFYCFDAADERVETIVAEVNNTPWGETHPYVLPRSRSEGRGTHRRFRFGKKFHVSPFMPMDVDYDWRFSTPGEKLTIHMENTRDGERFFDANLTTTRRKITGGALSRVLLRYPLMTAQVTLAIYWHALRLRLKRCPFFAHPKTLVNLEPRDEQNVDPEPARHETSDDFPADEPVAARHPAPVGTVGMGSRHPS